MLALFLGSLQNGGGELGIGLHVIFQHNAFALTIK